MSAALILDAINTHRIALRAIYAELAVVGGSALMGCDPARARALRTALGQLEAACVGLATPDTLDVAWRIAAGWGVSATGPSLEHAETLVAHFASRAFAELARECGSDPIDVETAILSVGRPPEHVLDSGCPTAHYYEWLLDQLAARSAAAAQAECDREVAS
jgi:hypothetical protein